MSQDYPKRAIEYGFASKDEIKELAADPGAFFLDVRNEQEIAEDKLDSRQFVHAPCTFADCSYLRTKASVLLPDKDAPIVVFCRSGRRAMKAKDTLSEMGYTKVHNAGGLVDLDHL